MIVDESQEFEELMDQQSLEFETFEDFDISERVFQRSNYFYHYASRRFYRFDYNFHNNVYFNVRCISVNDVSPERITDIAFGDLFYEVTREDHNPASQYTMYLFLVTVRHIRSIAERCNDVRIFLSVAV